MQDDDYKIVAAMEEFGGGFVKALAQAAFRADSDNLRRLKLAFPEYWMEYAQIAARERARRAGDVT